MNTKESAAKLEYKDNIQEGSETIPKGSTHIYNETNSCNVCGSATDPTAKDEGREIVRNKRFNNFLEKAKSKFGYKYVSL